MPVLIRKEFEKGRQTEAGLKELVGYL